MCMLYIQQDYFAFYRFVCLDRQFSRRKRKTNLCIQHFESRSTNYIHVQLTIFKMFYLPKSQYTINMSEISRSLTSHGATEILFSRAKARLNIGSTHYKSCRIIEAQISGESNKNISLRVEASRCSTTERDLAEMLSRSKRGGTPGKKQHTELFR